MNITNSPNFTGTYIKPATILKNNNPIQASIIQLDKNDLRAVETVVENWDTDISNLISRSFYNDIMPRNKKIYALSTQNTDFKKLNPSKVLALFEVEEQPKKYTLNYLDVNPKHKHNSETPAKKIKFHSIGKACIEFIKSAFIDKERDLYSVESAKRFYEKIGCQKVPSESNNRYLIV